MEKPQTYLENNEFHQNNHWPSKCISRIWNLSGEKNQFCRINYWPSKHICKIWNFPFWPHHLNYVENMKYSNMQILLVKFLVWLEIWEGLLSWTKKLRNIIWSWSILICVFGIPMHRWNHLAALLSQKFENLFLFDYRTDLKDAWQIAREFLPLSCTYWVINKLDIWCGEKLSQMRLI